MATVLAALVGAALIGSAHAQQKQWAVYVMKPDGSQVRKLAQAAGFTNHNLPRWSRDGKRVLFDVSTGNRASHKLFVVNADGTDLKELGLNSHGDWSPDDKQFVAEFYPASGTTDVCVQNVEGGERTTIATGTSPCWSPDGAKLAYADQGNVFVADLLSGETRALFQSPVANIFGGFAWFPDSSQLAVVARPAEGNLRELRFVSVDGEEKGMTVRLKNEMGGGLSFSPDGKRLVYSNMYKVHIVEVAGKENPQLVPHQTGLNKHPSWSPDGNWIVFSSDRESR
jgi:Tol biopolymer transport system component